METRFTILLIEVGVAVLVQIGVLLAILMAVRKSSARVESLAAEIQQRALPTLDAAQQMITTTRPQIEQIIANTAAATTTLKSQLERVDTAVNDIVDRTRLHIIRADELVTRTMDRVEETTEMVHHTVISPVRQIAGIIQGLTAGIGAFLGRPRDPRHAGAQHDEMFI